MTTLPEHPAASPNWQALARAVGRHAEQLILSNADRMSRIMRDEESATIKCSIGVAATEHQGGYDMEVTLSYSQRHKDSTGEFVDPLQAMLPLEVRRE
jgi:hypothetical protein